jgi:L-methionine (R)-S-oxide reductase
MENHRLLREALFASQCQTGTLHQLTVESQVLRLVAQVGLPEEVMKLVHEVPVGKGMAGLAAERKEPVQTCNLQTDESGDVRPGAKAVPVQASIALPILSQEEEVLGVLGLARAEEHEWSPEEIEALQLLANACGRAW